MAYLSRSQSQRVKEYINPSGSHNHFYSFLTQAFHQLSPGILSKLLVTFLHFPTPQDSSKASLLYFSGFIFHQKIDTYNFNYKNIETGILVDHLIPFPSNKSRQLRFTSVSIWTPSIPSILIMYSSYHLVLIKLETLLRVSRMAHKDTGK